MDPKSNSVFSINNILRNSRLGAFLLCVLIAACIWTVNAMNKTQHTVISVELRYNEAWLSSWSAGNQPTHIEMQLSGRGFDLARFIFKHPHAAVEIKEQGLFNTDNQIDSREIVLPLLESFAGRIAVDRVKPEIIQLPSRKSYFKRVAIRPAFDLKLKNSYMVAGPAVCIPDSIWLSSTSPLPDTLKTIYTTLVSKNDVNDKVFESVNLNLSGLKNIIPEIKSAWIYIPIEQSTEVILKIPLIPETKKGNVQLIPAEIELSCRVPLSKFETTTSSSIQLLAVIDQPNQKKAIVQLKKAPWWADRITWKPSTVDFIFY